MVGWVRQLSEEDAIPDPLTIPDIHVYVHFQIDAPASVPMDPRIDRMLALLEQISTQEATITTTIKDVMDAVVAESSVDASAAALLKQLFDQVQANIEDPAALQSIIDQVHANSDPLAAAIVANTPAAPAGAVTPTPVTDPSVPITQPVDGGSGTPTDGGGGLDSGNVPTGGSVPTGPSGNPDPATSDPNAPVEPTQGL